MEALVRQARVDLAAFTADEALAEGGGDPLQLAEVALAQAVTALRYNDEAQVPLVRELRALVEAVSPLIAGTADPASVA
jgi:hypothetical protein